MQTIEAPVFIHHGIGVIRGPHRCGGAGVLEGANPLRQSLANVRFIIPDRGSGADFVLNELAQRRHIRQQACQTKTLDHPAHVIFCRQVIKRYFRCIVRVTALQADVACGAAMHEFQPEGEGDAGWAEVCR